MKVFCTICLLMLASALHAQVDPNATKEARALYLRMMSMQGKGVMFGHQDALAYGLTADGTRWMNEDNRSDVKSVAGNHPAVAGWDLGRLEFDSANDLDGVPFRTVREQAVKHHLRGGINTFSWHLNNPLDPTKTAWDKVGKTIPRILASEQALKDYHVWLDKVAAFFLSLRTPGGSLVPVVFRPFHEHTGSWFWWGADHCTPEEYKRFWKLTIEYLWSKGVHNMLVAYSTDRFSSKQHYLERYPGNEHVDLVGFDIYHRNAPTSDDAFKKEFGTMVNTLIEVASENHKLCAVTEIGLERLTEKDWWTNIILPVVADTKLSYFLVWRNGRPDHFYAPYPGQQSSEDFIKMISTGKVLLCK